MSARVALLTHAIGRRSRLYRNPEPRTTAAPWLRPLASDTSQSCQISSNQHQRHRIGVSGDDVGLGSFEGVREPLSAPFVTGMSAAGAAGVCSPSARGMSVAWPVAVIGAVLYGSLLPFSMDWSAFRLGNAFGFLDLGLLPANTEDVIVNVLVYIPVGLLLALSGRGDTVRRLARVPLIVFVGAIVSVTAEVLQTSMDARCASWLDVFLNVTGTALGAVLGAGVFSAGVIALRRVRRSMIDRPFTTLSSMLAIGLVLYGVAPFDFVTDTAALHASFLRARLDLAAPRPTPFGGPPYAMMIQQLVGAAWFAALGWSLALAAFEKNRRVRRSPPLPRGDERQQAPRAVHGYPLRIDPPSRQSPAQTRAIAFNSALTQGVAVAVLIECLQLFTQSHVSDLATLMLRALAVALASWWAAFVGGAEWSANGHWQPRRLIPTTALVTLATGHAMALILVSVHLNVPWFAGIDGATIRWLPFEALWLCPIPQAMGDILSTLANYAVLAVVLAVVLRRVRVRAAWVKTGTLLVLLALAVEGLQVPSALQTADITDPVLALFAVIAVSRTYPWLRSWRPPIAARASVD